jgi:hypothetical protein
MNCATAVPLPLYFALADTLIYFLIVLRIVYLPLWFVARAFINYPSRQWLVRRQFSSFILAARAFSVTLMTGTPSIFFLPWGITVHSPIVVTPSMILHHCFGHSVMLITRAPLIYSSSYFGLLLWAVVLLSVCLHAILLYTHTLTAILFLCLGPSS